MTRLGGWEEIHPNMHHLVDVKNRKVWIAQRDSAMWALYLFGLLIATRPTLTEAQRAAHEHARKTNG